MTTFKFWLHLTQLEYVSKNTQKARANIKAIQNDPK